MKNNILGIDISSPDKIIYKELNVTKLEVVKYYEYIADLMLPYLKNRPLSVVRCPSGANHECFFKKHPSTDVNTNSFTKDGEEFFCIENKKDIIAQAQMGTIEYHINGANIKNLSKPNFMVFDLDPDEKLSLEKLRQGVLCLKEVMDSLNLKSYLKTSGGKGYHIVIPFKNCKDWKTFSKFAENIALLCEQKYPNIFTSNIRKNARGNKIFLDYLRNKESSTCVSPYSLRSRETASISMPISWKNLNVIAPNEITIKNYKKYIKTNPWKDFFEQNQKLS